MLFRLMTPDDYEKVNTLWQNTPGMGLNTVDDSREGIARYLKRNPSTCFVAEIDTGIIGVVLCGHDGRRGMIYHMAVAIDYRGQGIGSQLVDHALHALKQEGIQKVFLVVFATNEIGNTFWEKRGFAVRGDLLYRDYTLSTCSCPC